MELGILRELVEHPPQLELVRLADMDREIAQQPEQEADISRRDIADGDLRHGSRTSRRRRP